MTHAREGQCRWEDWEGESNLRHLRGDGFTTLLLARLVQLGTERTALGISWVKGSLCLVLKFTSHPRLDSCTDKGWE